MKRHRTAQTAAWIFGRPMKPCPTCAGYDLGFSVPIKLPEEPPPNADAKTLLRLWAQAQKTGPVQVQGTARIMCRDCGHLGPFIAVSGSAKTVCEDPQVASQVKDAWNNQPHPWPADVSAQTAPA